MKGVPLLPLSPRMNYLDSNPLTTSQILIYRKSSCQRQIALDDFWKEERKLDKLARMCMLANCDPFCCLGSPFVNRAAIQLSLTKKKSPQKHRSLFTTHQIGLQLLSYSIQPHELIGYPTKSTLAQGKAFCFLALNPSGKVQHMHAFCV